jgi:hypothetical protein
MFFDTGKHALMIYTGTQWIEAESSTHMMTEVVECGWMDEPEQRGQTLNEIAEPMVVWLTLNEIGDFTFEPYFSSDGIRVRTRLRFRFREASAADRFRVFWGGIRISG